jgi:hypothetical protein
MSVEPGSVSYAYGFSSRQALYFLFSHLLHKSGALVDGRTPNIFAAISLYNNLSKGT